MPARLRTVGSASPLFGHLCAGIILLEGHQGKVLRYEVVG
jgi:hypothetical protein